MLPHNSFCSHNRTVGSQILNIKVSRMTTLTQKYSKVERSFHCSHILLKCWPCTLHLTPAGTDVKYSKALWFHIWAFSLGADYSFLHLHCMYKIQTNKMLFHVQVSVARRAFTHREVSAHHIWQLRSDRPQNAQLDAERCQNMYRGWWPLRHIPDDRRETAHTQLSPSVEKQGKFPHPQAKGKFLLPVFPA